MAQTAIEQEITELVADIVEMDPKSIDPNAHLVEDLGMDSMMALEILAAIERRYKIKIPEEELPSIVSINKAIALAKKYARKK